MKKTLALILAIVLCFSLFVIGASATTDEFTDKDEITNTKSVNLLVGLGVINGMGDGTFDPSGTVTRAQMCQIVAKICNGGTLPNISSAQQHFTDVPATYWGFSAIEYCYGKGIVSGMGDGTFAPDSPLTGSQCSKILLVAMGYNESVHHLTGASWEIYTAVLANSNDFYDGIKGTFDVSNPISRENVCQIAYNMLNAPVVKVQQSIDSDGKITSTYSQTSAAGTDNDDVLEVYFGVSIEYGYITASSYNSTKKEFTYTTTAAATFGGAAVTKDAMSETSLTSETDYSSLIGQKVCFVYDAEDTSDVYDIYADSDSSILATGTLADLTDKDGNGLTQNVTTTGHENGGIPTSGVIATSDTKVEVNGTAYSLTNAASATTVVCSKGYLTTSDATGANDPTPFFDLAELSNRVASQISGSYVNEGNNIDSTNRYARPWWNIKLIDNTGDGKADCVYLYPVDIAKVTYVGTTSLSLTRVDGDKCDWSAGSIDLDASGWSFNKDLEKSDFVVITKDSQDTKTVTPLTVVEGKVEGQKAFSGKIDGVFYNSTPTDGDDIDYLALSSSYELQVYNGYVFDVDTLSYASTDLLVVKKASGESTDVNGCQANVLFMDGTTKAVTLAEVDGDDTPNAADGYTDTLYTYSVNSDGEYEIETVDSGNLAGCDGIVGSAVTDFNEKTSSAPANFATASTTYTIDDSAVIILKYNSTKYAVISGADMKTYSHLDLIDTTTNNQFLYNTTGGISSIQVAFAVTDATNIGADYVYGYVTSSPYTVKVDSKTYWYYTAWTKDGAVEVYDTKTSVTPGKGTPIALMLNTDGTYTNQEKDFEEVAISGYSASDEIISMIYLDTDPTPDVTAYYGGANLKLPTKTTIINIDNGNTKGISGDSISVANSDSNDVYTTNAWAYYSSSNNTLCVICDVTNDLGTGTTFALPT